MVRQRLRLALCNHDGENWRSKNIHDPRVQRPARLAQQRAVGRILNQSMLERIGRIRWPASPEQRPSFNETFERRAKLRVGLLGHGS